MPQALQRNVAIEQRLDMIGLDRKRPVKGCQGVLEAPQIVQGDAAVDQRLDMAGVDRQRLVIVNASG